MARAGIYKTEVVRARNNLLAIGRRPSIDAIRAELGNTGSKTTIQRYLKEIEEENGHAGTKVAASEAILDLSTRLADQLHQEADQQIAVLTDKHKAEIAELNNIISALRNEIALFRGRTEQLTLEFAAEKTAHADTQAQLQTERVSSAQLVQRIVGKYFFITHPHVSTTWKLNRPEKKSTDSLWRKNIYMQGKPWNIFAWQLKNSVNKIIGSSNNRSSSCKTNCV